MIKVRIEDVSKNHQSQVRVPRSLRRSTAALRRACFFGVAYVAAPHTQKFVIHFVPQVHSVAPCHSLPIEVRSKPKDAPRIRGTVPTIIQAAPPLPLPPPPRERRKRPRLEPLPTSKEDKCVKHPCQC